MKHTQNNWTVNTYPRKDAEIAIGAAGTPLIALVMLRDVSINEQKANAQLIAAAPRMLERLRVVNTYLDRAIIALLYSSKENDRFLAKLLDIEKGMIAAEINRATNAK